MHEFKVSDSNETIDFKIGEDVFHAVAPARLPGNVLMRYAEQVGAGKLYEANKTFFNRSLVDESATLFEFRLDSKENPINLETMAEVVEWLIGKYSNLSTPASSASSTSS